jgi:ATP-dependent DNA helicase DinG
MSNATSSRPADGASAPDRYAPAVAASSPADDAARALERVTAQLPGGGEAREGQLQMVRAVADGIANGKHVVVQAGTGTGKSLGYLVPALLSGKHVVVATATKALQDQLAEKDLPFLQQHLGRPVRFAVLKGRSNYVCRQRLGEMGRGGADAQLGLDGVADDAVQKQVKRIRAWAETTETGDRAELDFEPSGAVWTSVSVGVRECPGANRCPVGAECFAEKARRRAQDVDVVIVNLHLFALDVVLGGIILPPHDVAIIDEAHQTEDTVAAAAGFELAQTRFVHLARVAAGILADASTQLADVESAGVRVVDEIAARRNQRLRPPLDDSLQDALDLARQRVERLGHAMRSVPENAPGDVPARKLRAVQAITALLGDLDSVLHLRDTDVAWVEGTDAAPVLRVAPIDIAKLLRERLWNDRTAVLTSATLPPRLTERLGLEAGTVTQLDVGSPFDYEHAALLYCAADLPDPRSPDYRPALHRELESLIVAAGGRTLALFTSWKAMHEAVEQLRPRLPWKVFAQGDLPKAALLQAFSEDHESSLFATMSFWQGVDVPGASLSLVTVDRLPFPRPDDPLLEARRELAGAQAFRTIDVPRAATLLAQGAGRLIRTANDRGVVAVFDPRLATSRSYRWDIVNALPPMRRTRVRAEAEAFLRELRDAEEGATPPASASRR